MLGGIIGAGIGAIGSILGGNKAAKSAEKQQALNYEQQKEFAQKGIQWKVQDAKAAGIHPLAALGAQTHAYQSQNLFAGDGGFAAAGQDLGRAAKAALDRPDQVARDIQLQQAHLTTRNMELKNELLGVQIAKERQPATPPGPPPLATTRSGPGFSKASRYLLDGQGDTVVGGGRGQPPPMSSVYDDPRIVRDVPMKRIRSAPERPHQEGAAVPDVGYSRTSSGYFPVIPHDLQERLEDDHLGILMWNARNRLAPMVGLNESPPPVELPDGQIWKFNPFTLQYEPHTDAYIPY